jgi:hypothetical protein
VKLVDKQTFTGEDIREYYCAACDESFLERGGMAFWSIANEKLRSIQERLSLRNEAVAASNQQPPHP